MKLGKTAKHRQERKEKAEILAQENFQEWENQLIRGTLTPLLYEHDRSLILNAFNDISFVQHIVNRCTHFVPCLF